MDYFNETDREQNKQKYYLIEYLLIFEEKLHKVNIIFIMCIFNLIFFIIIIYNTYLTIKIKMKNVAEDQILPELEMNLLDLNNHYPFVCTNIYIYIYIYIYI